MLGIVRIALSRPYTFIVLALLILIVGPLAALRTPTDIFPDISIPVIAVVWTLHRPAAGRDGRPHHLRPTSAADHDGQRHRAHRGAVAARRRHRQDLLPAGRRHPHRDRPGHLDLADGAEADAARHHAAADPQLQRLDRADPAAGAVQQGAVANRSSATSARTSSARAGDGAGRGDSLPLRRQARARCRSTSTRRRCRRKGLSAQDVANALAAQNQIIPAGTAKIGDFEYNVQLNNSPDGDRGAERPADQDGQRRHHLHPRRRPRARRLAAADQYRARRRPARGADDRPEDRLGLDAGDRRRHQAAAAAASRRRCRRRCKIDAARRPVAVREGGDHRRGRAKA